MYTGLFCVKSVCIFMSDKSWIIHNVVYRALLSVYSALLKVDRSLLGEYRALLGVLKTILSM